MATTHPRRESAQVQPDAAAQYLQRTAASWMKANEQIMRGFTSIVKREFELGQELSRLNFLPVPAEKTNGSMATPNYSGFLQQNYKGLELVLTNIREVASELSQCLTGVTKTLLEELASANQDMITEAAAKATYQAEQASATVLKAGQGQAE